MRLVRPLLLALLLFPSLLTAQKPAKPRSFSLLGRAAATLIFHPNRTGCGVSPIEIGPRNFSSTGAGCFWPEGSTNQYVFNSGLQVAGIVGADGQDWAGDTAGAFFFDPKGTTEHGDALTGVYLSSNPTDTLAWPKDARVPGGAGSLFLPSVSGQVRASDFDAWSLAWEGNSSRRAGRTHPLGIMLETRLLGWNAPRGNEDILYILFTLYNITATDPVVYGGIRPELRPRILQVAQRFRASADSVLGYAVPAAGYSITSLFAGLAMDPDIGDAGSNYASANLPLSMGYAWDYAFSRPPGWSFDLADHGSPFFAGAGFVGTKVLRAPAGGNAIQVFSSLSGGSGAGVVGPPRDVTQLYRYLAGTTAPALGDQPCNMGNQQVTHFCYLKSDAASDTRDFMSVSGGNLAPGEFTTFVIAYLFAAPYGGCPASCDVKPGNPTRLNDPVALAGGANPIDSLAGYRGYADLNGDGVVQGGEIRAAPRSLLGKAQMAQALFDNQFQLPEAPVAPAFFLVPGDNQVTVLWKPSATEATGDPYFAMAALATTTNPSGVVSINPLYDPNYRQFDVEGYRIYRSRTPDFQEAELVRQFDYSGTVIKDFTGRVNPALDCAPELGIRSGCASLDSLVPGQPLQRFVSHSLVNTLVQVRDGERARGAEPIAYLLRSDTLGTDYATGRCLCDTGVPFTFTDNTVRNGFTYYYSVVAFDVNSLQSGPSSMESARRSRSTRPARSGINVDNNGSVTVALMGRGKLLDSALAEPTIDPVTGRFSGPFPPANAWRTELGEFVTTLYAGTQEARIHLDSITLGRSGISEEGIPAQYHFSVQGAGQGQQVTIPIVQGSGFRDEREARQQFALFATDSTLSARYNGVSVPLQSGVLLTLPGTQSTGEWGRYALNTATNAQYNGIRWFDGPSPDRNEAMPDPTGANCAPSSLGCPLTGPFAYGNGGQLTHVTTVYQPLAYLNISREWRSIGEAQAGARRAADYNVHWGTGGVIDSVIDVTHNVPVPFSERAGGTWGILNTTSQGDGGFDNRPTVLTPADWSCVEPFRSQAPVAISLPCASATPFSLVRQAELGTVAFAAGDQQSTTNPGSVRNTSNLSFEPGFSLYLAGTISQFAMTALPTRGTVWALRDYVGAIRGGKAEGAYSLEANSFAGNRRPLTAVGVDIVVRGTAPNTNAAVRDRDLRRVHPVPDPYYFRGGLPDREGVRFVNLPARATIRIYSASGVLLRVLDHQPATQEGESYWDLRTRNGQRVASGVYFYHVESGDARRVGRMTIVNYTN